MRGNKNAYHIIIKKIQSSCFPLKMCNRENILGVFSVTNGAQSCLNNL